MAHRDFQMFSPWDFETCGLLIFSHLDFGTSAFWDSVGLFGTLGLRDFSILGLCDFWTLGLWDFVAASGVRGALGLWEFGR